MLRRVLGLTKQEAFEGKGGVVLAGSCNSGVQWLKNCWWGNLGSGGCGQPCPGAWPPVKSGGCRNPVGADQWWGQGWGAPASDTHGKEQSPSQCLQSRWWPSPVRGFFLWEGCGRVPWELCGSCLQGPGVLPPCPLGQGFLAKVLSLLPCYFEDLPHNSSHEQLCSWASLILNNYTVSPVTVCMPRWAQWGWSLVTILLCQQNRLILLIVRLDRQQLRCPAFSCIHKSLCCP